MTSELKCPLCGHYAKDDGLNNTWWCSNQYCDSYEENSSKPYHALMNAIRDLEIARKALEYYADSRFGRKQDDGTYVLEIDKGCGVAVVYTYDPRPAKQALEQIDHFADVSKMLEHKE